MIKYLQSLGFILITLVPSLYADDGYERNPRADILHYRFSVSISDTSNLICGKAQISLKALGILDSLGFDLVNIQPDGRGMIVDTVLYNDEICNWIHRDDRIIITQAVPAGKGSDISVTIVYHGIPADGLIISNNKFGSRTFFSDHWPDRARNYLPCIDHPYEKATVEFIITAPERYGVVANGYLVEESTLEGNTRLTHWKEDVPLPTKVMAFGAAEFATQLSGEDNGIKVWSWVFRENRKEGFNDYSGAVKPLAFYSRMIGQYPFEKLANVQSKTIYGGMENAGCIFYAENSVTGRGEEESLLAHEIAHQWFGNSVTEDDWYHVWLSEGFATYHTSLYLGETYGPGLLGESMKSARDRVLDFYLKSGRPVVDTTVTSLMKLLNTNSYQKGAWVLHMLRNEIGDDMFRRGIRLFYERYRNDNVVTGDLKDVMEEVSRKDLDSFFLQWLYIAGQPELKITSQPSSVRGRTVIIIEQMQDRLFEFPLELMVRDDENIAVEKLRISERITRLTLKTGNIRE